MRDFMLANGWGVVHDENGAHWVYIPLWDPPKFNEVGRALFISLVIKQHLAAIGDAKVKEQLKGIVQEQAKIVSSGFAAAMEGDGYCGTPYPHHIPIPGGGFGGDPENPVYQKGLGAKVSAQINAKAALSILGQVLKVQRITDLAHQI